ncbi:hypothetical protein FBU30_000275 [Linnemannia zychae]|nr:hypothetical protein FBU30_000275 [Linnemannia zychae]
MAMYLDIYEQTFEAAKGFDDDFDFCPSLSPTEASASSPSLSSSPSASPPLSPATPAVPTTSRAIAIVDPVSRTPVQIPSGTSSTTATSMTAAATTTAATTTSTIGSSTSLSNPTAVTGGYFSGASHPVMFHEPALTIESSANASSLYAPSPLSPSSLGSSEDMDGSAQFWMDPSSIQQQQQAQYFSYPAGPDPFTGFAPAYPFQHQAMGPPGYVAVPMMMMGF